MKLLEKILKYCSFDKGVLIARLWRGSIILKHSCDYLFGGKMKELTDFLTTLDFPYPESMAYLSQGTELVTAVLVILGVCG